MRDYRLNGAVSHPTFDWQRTLAGINQENLRPVYLRSWRLEFSFSIKRTGWRFLGAFRSRRVDGRQQKILPKIDEFNCREVYIRSGCVFTLVRGDIICRRCRSWTRYFSSFFKIRSA
jgi:hypothetical protein